MAAMPGKFETLAVYNAEVARGIVHTPEWDARMAELQAEYDQLQQRPVGLDIPAGCICAYTWDTTGSIVRNGQRRDCTVHGDEDRIRDAMAEAQAHPGRTITR